MARTSRNTPPGLRALVAVSILGLAACSTGASASPSPASVASATPSASAEASASAESQAAQATAVPTSVDPCQLVTAQEVSAITGATFTAGQASAGTNNVKT